MVDKTIPDLDPVVTPAATDRFGVRQAGDVEDKRETRLQVHTLEVGEHFTLPQVDEEATPTLAFGDGDTGFWESADGILKVGVEGSALFVWSTGSFTAEIAGGPALLNELSTVTNPTLLPHRSNADTGIGGLATNDLSLITGGLAAIRYVEASTEVLQIVRAPDFVVANGGGGQGSATILLSSYNAISTVTSDDDSVKLPATHEVGTLITVINAGSGNRLAVFPATGDSFLGLAINLPHFLMVNTSATYISRSANNTWQRISDGQSSLYPTNSAGAVRPSVGFGDGDTGLYESADDVLNVSVAGTDEFNFAAGTFQAEDAGGPALLNVLAGTTQPTLIPNKTDPDTGIAWPTLDVLNVVVGGVEGQRWAEANSQVIVRHVGTFTLLTADTTPSQGDVPMENNYAAANVVASPDDSITATTAQIGTPMAILNTGANVLQVFPNTSDDIGAGVNNSIQIPVGYGREWLASTNILYTPMITSALSAFNAAGPEILDEAATATNPTLIPNRAEQDTGIGWTGADVMSLIVGGASIFEVTSAGLEAVNANGPQVLNAAASNVIPVFIVDATDPDTGIGGLSDRLDIIVGGVQGFRVDEGDEDTGDILIAYPTQEIAITAFATGGQASAFQLGNTISIITTCASAGDSVKLMRPSVNGAWVYVRNDGAESCDVFPFSGDDLGQGVDTAVAIPSGSTRSFISTTINGDTWVEMIEPAAGVAESLLASEVAGPAIVDEEATATNPTLIPNRAELDTGFGWESADIISVVLGGAQTFSFGAGSEEGFFAESANGPAMLNENVTFANPGLIPNRTDPNTGIGWRAADALVMVIGGDPAAEFTRAASENLFNLTVEGFITAFSGGGQGSAFALDSSMSNVTTVAAAADSVRLPAVFKRGTMMFVGNSDSTDSMDVFPASGDNLGAGVDTAIQVAAGGAALFFAVVANAEWLQIKG